MTTDDSGGPAARAAVARRIIRSASMAAIATLDADTEAPYASLVGVATAMDGAPLTLMSTLAQHRRNIEADPRISVLYDATAGHDDPLAGTRVSVMGRIAVSENADEARRFRARHPGAFYSDFADFAFFRIEPERAHLVAGFGKVDWIDRADIVLGPASVGALGAAEADIVGHMNRDHADAVSLYATMLIGAEPAAWKMTGIDPEGADLAAGSDRIRLPFPELVRDPDAARAVLVRLVQEARARGDT